MDKHCLEINDVPFKEHNKIWYDKTYETYNGLNRFLEGVACMDILEVQYFLMEKIHIGPLINYYHFAEMFQETRSHELLMELS